MEAAASKEVVAPWMAAPYINKWLEECRRNHWACYRSIAGDIEGLEASAATTWPTRLLRISDSNKVGVPLVSLVETGGAHIGDYITLSHCWGPPGKRPYCTKVGNKEQHYRSIPFDDLPLTFQDATMISYCMGISYLWIDSLCIVQDDKEDWDKESMIMGEIYANAVLSFAAQSAHDSSEGLFKIRQPFQTAQLWFDPRKGASVGSILVLDSAAFHQSFMYLEGSPLQKRGWVMQEYILSRRIVHFTSLGMVFTCYGEQASKHGALSSDRFSRTEFGMGQVSRPIDTWIELVQAYSARNLTYQSDKLAAVHGIASALARRNQTTYYHGLFLDYFPRHLAWFPCDSKAQRATHPSIPSWSWASMTGGIRMNDSFKGVHLKDEVPRGWQCKNICQLVKSGNGIHPGALELSGKPIPVRVLHGEHWCQFYGGFFFGIRDLLELHAVEIEEAWAKCRAQNQGFSQPRSCNVRCVAKPKEQRKGNTRGIFIISGAENDLAGWCSFDEGIPVLDVLHFLPIYQFESVCSHRWVRSQGKHRWWCLLVKATAGRPPTFYQRVGFGVLEEGQLLNRSFEQVFLI
ncbi:hypothetical protein Asppvi_009840 [Aspergillus pseudoviridinutans]|uniref:Heterokaryon incompatibility domain-containing protein n=1 Tax=Aspergillus pseudoviridinutans TaxID=1517512 RepID=A0A9P3BGP0_9EURO|nr:uncharacterized protein Asppvi_009840 [Aspergillus pseudoviridinutans]GIJ90875.1 hypothetical protein Asppvi_009840 [Aspergillus pseudoviridinutans]